MTYEELVEAGYNSWVASALSRQKVTVEDLNTKSAEELLDLVLQWYGIINYTSSIINALDNLRNMEAI